MNDFIQRQLDKVLKLAREKQQVINQIRSFDKKKRGLAYLAVTADERELMVTRASKQYDSRITGVYNRINEQLKALGQEEIQNPFEVNKEGET